MAVVRKIVLAGGSGFLGRTLAKWFAARAWEVVVLSRSGSEIPGARVVTWDGINLGPWCVELEGATALINLAGRSVNCRYHDRNRREILDSRICSTRAIGEAIRACGKPPAVWLNSSTATIYKHTYGTPHDEQGETGATVEARDAFSIEVARAWEKEFEAAKCPQTRKVALRTAVVLGREPGCAYAVLRRLALLGLGGTVADGRQYFSWIHADDFCRALEWLIEHDKCSGIYNIAAPNPLTNRDMTKKIRQALRVPVGLPTKGWMLEFGAWLLQTESELIIKSRRVVAGRLAAEGFVFTYPHLGDAVEALEGRIK